MNLSYTLTVESFAQSESRTIEISNKPGSTYYIESFKFDYDILDPLSNKGVVKLVSSGTQTINPVVDFAAGNILKFTIDGARRYVGYIDSWSVSKSAGTGTTINLNVNTLLMSWAKQMTINSYDDSVVLGSSTTLSDYSSNKVKIEDVLNWFSYDSVVSYANPSFEIPYKFRNGGENLLDKSTPVWFYANTNKSRLETIQQTLQPYQRIIYQDASGMIRIEPLSVGNTSKFSFDLNSNSKEGYTKWLSYTYSDRSAAVANRSYCSLLPIGINMSGLNEGSASVVSVTTPSSGNGSFKRSEELLNSKQFEQSINYTCDLSTEMVTDPTLMTYYSADSKGLTAALSGNSPLTFPGLPESNNNTTAGNVTKIFSQLALARAMFNSAQLSIDLPYVSAGGESFPLGEMVQIHAPFLTPVVSWFCYGCSYSFSPSKGSILTLRLCKPYSYNAYWTSNLS